MRLVQDAEGAAQGHHWVVDSGDAKSLALPEGHVVLRSLKDRGLMLVARLVVGDEAERVLEESQSRRVARN